MYINRKCLHMYFISISLKMKKYHIVHKNTKMDFFGCLKKHEIEEIKKKQKELIWILFVIKKNGLTRLGFSLYHL